MMGKIGNLNYKNFETEFWVTPTILKYCKKEKISEANFIPDGQLWYEIQLFDIIKDLNKKVGKKFKVIYYGWVTKRNLNTKTNKLKEKNKIDKINFPQNKLIQDGEIRNNLGLFKAIILKK
jgi:hypothetical protein